MIEHLADIKHALLALSMLFLAFMILRAKVDGKLNWAMSYAGLWVAASLYFVDRLCVSKGWWTYLDEGVVCTMPFDLYFVWVVIWGVLAVYISRCRYPLVVAGVLFYIDILIMPYLAQAGQLDLGDQWMLGELTSIGLVCLPALYWARAVYQDKWVGYRAFMQVMTFGIVMLFALPELVAPSLEDPSRSSDIPYIWLYLLAVVPFCLVGLYGVKELVEKGKGTAFPFDPTKKLVRNGMYAYIRNPIQLSAALVFIPMALYLENLIYLIGAVAAVLYSLGFAALSEEEQMEARYGEAFVRYRSLVPSWRFSWRPKAMPQATLYFKQDCNYCQQMRSWCERRSAINVTYKHSHEYPGAELTEMHYEDEDGLRYGSVLGVAHFLGHINLLCAIMGWLIRLPGVSHLLQQIVDLLDLGNDEVGACLIEEE